MKTLKLNQKGFSLVELMVVVAIIGILATIGIPQYQKFMAKARQSEAKTHLNAIFQGESSFFTEYNHYSVSLRNIGSAAVGQNLRYNAGFTINACAAATYPVTAPPEGAADDNNDLLDANVNTAVNPATWQYWAADAETDAAGIVAAAASTCTQGAFLATAWGNPTNTNGALPNNAQNNLDQFTINESRVLSHASVGM
jgi:type IV pilus assembly protein PilA